MSTDDPLARASAAADRIALRSGVPAHDVALVLGSGWIDAADDLGETVAAFPADEIPGFHAPVSGQARLIRSIRTSTGTRLLVLGARSHLYQGFGAADVAHGVRTAAAAGARIVVLTNGAGGIRPDWEPGRLVLLADHINLTGASPLVGDTFVDLSDVYSARLRAVARSVAPTLDEGVYVQFRGPQYETPAEIRMARTLGADMVGMSTALEAIAARAAGLEVLGLSLITNAAAGVRDAPLSHDEVLAAGRDAQPALAALLAGIVGSL